MSVWKCLCGFDGGTEKAADEHLWEVYAERRAKLASGEMTLEQYRATQDKEHGVSVCRSSCCAHLLTD